MQNGYFQVVRTPGGYGLQIFQPKDGGEDVRLQEVMDYLDRQSIPYDSMSIKKAILAEEDAVCFLERKDCPEIEESCRIEVSEDNLQAIVRFYPASQTGKTGNNGQCDQRSPVPEYCLWNPDECSAGSFYV